MLGNLRARTSAAIVALAAVFLGVLPAVANASGITPEGGSALASTTSSAGIDAVEIAAGTYHSCAVLEDGTGAGGATPMASGATGHWWIVSRRPPSGGSLARSR
jgi:hypothetical protein